MIDITETLVTSLLSYVGYFRCRHLPRAFVKLQPPLLLFFHKSHRLHGVLLILEQGLLVLWD